MRQPLHNGGGVPVARTGIVRGAQTPRAHVAAGAAQLATVSDWVLLIDHTTWANHGATDRSRDLRVNN